MGGAAAQRGCSVGCRRSAAVLRESKDRGMGGAAAQWGCSVGCRPRRSAAGLRVEGGWQKCSCLQGEEGSI